MGFGTVTLTTAGITNPSSTTRAYKGVSNSKPPASGGALGVSVEFSTSDYTDASTSNNVYASQVGNSLQTYAGLLVQFYVPSYQRVISRIDFGMEGKASDGYVNGYGWTLYLKNNNTPAWDSIATVSGSFTDQSQTGSKTTTLSYWVDSNYRIQLLMMSNAIDGNGSGAEAYLDYTYVTLTYTNLVGYPGIFPGGKTEGFIAMGAVQPSKPTASLGFPGVFPGGNTTGYFTIGAVQKLSGSPPTPGGFTPRLMLLGVG